MKKVLAAVFAMLTIRRVATGYIDPNTGGMIFQMLAVLFGLLSGALLFFSSRIRMALARLRRRMRTKGSTVDVTGGEGSEQ